MQDERARQLYNLGVASGYSDEEVEVFIDYINETLQATTLQCPAETRAGGAHSKANEPAAGFDKTDKKT